MITDYTSLKASIVGYMKRQDLDAEVEIFIQLAEGSLNNNPEFRVREMSQSSTYISKDGLVPFYDDYLSLRSIRNTGGNALSLASPAIMAQSDGCSTCPRFYREEGRQLHISPAVDYVSLDITYYKKIPALSDINTTNWLLLKAPNVYLYGALIESTALVMNDERIGLWKSRYDEAVRQLIDADQGDRWSGSPTSVRLHDESTSCITDEESYVEGGELPAPPKFIALIPDQVSDRNILYTHGVSQYFSGEVTGYALYGAPTWLTMDADTGVMSGVPSAEALLTGLTVSASNSYGAVVSNEFGMRVLAVPSGPPRFDESTDQNLFDWHCNVNIPVSFNAVPHFTTGGAVATWSLNNAPSWLSIDTTTGVLRGTPTAPEAVKDVTITATNIKGADTSNPFNVQTLNTVAPHRYWRKVYFRNTTHLTYYGHIYTNQIEMMVAHGGDTVCAGGVCFDYSPVPTGRHCTSAFNGVFANGDWDIVMGSYPDCGHIGYDFGAGNEVAIVEFMHAVDPGSSALSLQPKEYAFQYSDDDINYVSIWNTVDDVDWAQGERRYHDIIEEV